MVESGTRVEWLQDKAVGSKDEIWERVMMEQWVREKKKHPVFGVIPC